MRPPRQYVRPMSAPLAAATAALLALAGCGEPVDDRPARLPATPAATGTPDATPLAAQLPAPPAKPAATAAAVAPADWAVTALLPQGDIDLPDGRVERSYRVVLANGPLERPAALLRLLATPPGVEVVRAGLSLGELPALAQVSPPDALRLRHPPELLLDPNMLQWALQDAPPAAASVQGRLLSGPAAQLALAAIVGHQAAPDPQPRTQLLAHLQPGATVGAVNQALRQAGLRIVQMRVGNHGLTLRPLAQEAGAAAWAQQQLQASALFSAIWLQAAAPPPPVVAQAITAASLPTDCAN
jgi:hypothetical protein